MQDAYLWERGASAPLRDDGARVARMFVFCAIFAPLARKAGRKPRAPKAVPTGTSALPGHPCLSVLIRGSIKFPHPLRPACSLDGSKPAKAALSGARTGQSPRYWSNKIGLTGQTSRSSSRNLWRSFHAATRIRIPFFAAWPLCVKFFSWRSHDSATRRAIAARFAGMSAIQP